MISVVSKNTLQSPVSYSVLIHFVFILLLAANTLWFKKVTKPEETTIVFTTNSYSAIKPSRQMRSDSISKNQASVNWNALLKQAQTPSNLKHAAKVAPQSFTGDSTQKLFKNWSPQNKNVKVDWRSLIHEENSGIKGFSLTTVDVNQILKIFGTKQNAFRDCYERQLLQDSQIQGYIDFKLSVNELARVSDTQLKFNGTGQTNSRNELFQCLKSVLKGVQLPKTVKNQVLQFGLYLKS